MTQAAITDLYNKFAKLKGDVEEQQRNVYIVAGVLGGVDVALILAIIALLYFISRVNKKIKDAEVQKKVEDEMDAQKFAAYTGEEMHRKLLAATTPAVPLGSQSEYAFNASFGENRALSPPPPAKGPGNSSSHLHRY